MEAENILNRLISINSVFGNEERIGNYLEGHLKSLGFSTKRQYFDKRRFNIFAERPGNGDPLLFYGHMDTVTPHGTWKIGPFKPLAEGDKLYGLGTFDMKGGIAAMLSAIEKNEGRRIKVLLCGDEENISKGAWTAVKNRGWFRDVKFTVSCEPGDSRRRAGGANVVTVGRRGRVVIDVDVQGVSSHAATNPQKGINAIEEAAKIATAVNLFKLRGHSKLGRENIFVRKIEGMAESALDFPDRAHLEFDIQLVPPSTPSDALARLNDVIDHLHRTGRLHTKTITKLRIKRRDTPYITPYAESLSNPMIRKVFSIIRQNLREPAVNYGSSVADDNILSNSIHRPIVTIGPRGGNEHAQNEWVSRKSLAELAFVYGKIIDEI